VKVTVCALSYSRASLLSGATRQRVTPTRVQVCSFIIICFVLSGLHISYYWQTSRPQNVFNEWLQNSRYGG